MKKYLLIILIFLLTSTVVLIIKRSAPRAGSVKVDGINIAYITYGRGEPLIMITGYNGTMDMWSRGFIRKLSKKYKVIVFDNRGMGKTTASDKEFTIKLFAQDTAGLMDALKIKKAHILGWSLGTYIAQELALNYPEKVDKLILYAADTGGKQAVDPDPKTLEILENTSSDNGMELLSLLLPQKWLEDNPDPRKYFPKVTETSPPENISRQYNAWRKWGGTYSRLKGLKTPTMLITGTEDILTPPENSKMMAKLIPNAKLVMIPGGGHGVMYQYPEGMADIIINFLH
ncbi:alpha/beta fold hydrolase [Candidatus Margulisiibacteriota bacterium]